MFGDNQFRYALLSLAACEAPLQLHIGGYRCATAYDTASFRVSLRGKPFLAVLLWRLVRFALL